MQAFAEAAYRGCAEGKHVVALEHEQKEQKEKKEKEEKERKKKEEEEEGGGGGGGEGMEQTKSSLFPSTPLVPTGLGLLASEDVAYLLAFSVIMLNTSLHNPNIGEDKKMKIEDFVKTNADYGREVSRGVKLPTSYLHR